MICWRTRWLFLLGWLALGCSRKGGEGRPGEGRPPAEGAPVPSVLPSATPAPSAVGSARTTELFGWGGIPPSIAAQRGAPEPLATQVLKALFPSSLPGLDRCPDTPGTPEQARSRGFVVPRVASRAAGAFSRPEVAEHVLGVLVGECGATHAEGWGTRRLVLWSDGKVARDLPLQGRLGGAADLDGDGTAELLIESGGTGQGITTTRLIVARLGPQGLTTLADLGVVYEGNCGAQRPEGEEVSIVSAVARGGASLDFELRRERRDCR